jgi:hypothetical protein
VPRNEAVLPSTIIANYIDIFLETRIMSRPEAMKKRLEYRRRNKIGNAKNQ